MPHDLPFGPQAALSKVAGSAEAETRRYEREDWRPDDRPSARQRNWLEVADVKISKNSRIELGTREGRFTGRPGSARAVASTHAALSAELLSPLGGSIDAP